MTTVTSTWGLARGLFTFDGRGESVYNMKSGLLMSSGEWSKYRKKEVKNSMLFDYGNGTATYTDDIHPANSRVIPMPQGDPSDLILALITDPLLEPLARPGARRARPLRGHRSTR